MRLFLLTILLIGSLAQPVCAADLTAPQVPDSGAAIMPERAETFGEGLWDLTWAAISRLRPDIRDGVQNCLGILAAALLTSLADCFPGIRKNAADLVGALAVSVVLLGSTNTLIRLGTETVTELSEYGKLLLPVMTAAMAAQGRVSASASLYMGTAVFSSVLTAFLSGMLVPMLYGFLALAVANSATEAEGLKKLRDFLKWAMVWGLKLILYVFTGYMGITGVVSGTTDAAALKAAKLTISGFVPVVGGILSEASEAVLISAGVIRNSAGIYGLLAVLSICMGPFLQIGTHYLLLKSTAALCAVFGSKRLTALIGDFSAAMGFVLAMTGSVCILLLISTVCFLGGTA